MAVTELTNDHASDAANELLGVRLRSLVTHAEIPMRYKRVRHREHACWALVFSLGHGWRQGLNTIDRLLTALLIDITKDAVLAPVRHVSFLDGKCTIVCGVIFATDAEAGDFDRTAVVEILNGY